MAMTKTGEPLNLSAPTSTDTPGWVADFAGNARATNDFAKATNTKIGDIATLQTEYKQNLVGAVNEVKNLDSKKAAINHASTGTSFGIGSTTAYGHTKVINDLNKTAYANGEALSAYQGKVLKDANTTVDNRVTKIYTDKLVTLDEIDLVTEQGFFVDALAVRELNSNFEWKYVDRHATSSNLTKTVAVPNLQHYKEIKIMCGMNSDSAEADFHRVLAEVSIPIEHFTKFVRDTSNGWHQAYYSSDISAGVSYMGNNDIKLYAKNSKTICYIYIR